MPRIEIASTTSTAPCSNALSPFIISGIDSLLKRFYRDIQREEIQSLGDSAPCSFVAYSPFIMRCQALLSAKRKPAECSALLLFGNYNNSEAPGRQPGGASPCHSGAP